MPELPRAKEDEKRQTGDARFLAFYKSKNKKNKKEDEVFRWGKENNGKALQKIEQILLTQGQTKKNKGQDEVGTKLSEHDLS